MSAKRLTQQEFIEKARLVHKNKYDYSLVEYVKSSEKVKIICPIHDVFLQKANNHIQGGGCPSCGTIDREKSKSVNKLKNKYFSVIQPEEYKLIALTKGKFAKVDNEDFDKLNNVSWTLTKKGYCMNFYLGKMHRFLINCPEDMVVDHINRDKLDNRKSNLRICTNKENARNRNIKSGHTSKYKGVYWSEKSKKWRASITSDEKRFNLGMFEDEEEAARCYDLKAKELHKEFANTNFKYND